MRRSKVVTSGNSQAVLIPKEYEVQEEELYIQRIGRTMILFPTSDPWESFVQSLGEFREDFMREGRNQPRQQEREEA